VLVATHVLHKQVGGVAWFIVLGLASLALATAVAFYLARRFTRPLVEAVEATEKIAGAISVSGSTSPPTTSLSWPSSGPPSTP